MSHLSRTHAFQEGPVFPSQRSDAPPSSRRGDQPPSSRARIVEGGAKPGDPLQLLQKATYAPRIRALADLTAHASKRGPSPLSMLSLGMAALIALSVADVLGEGCAGRDSGEKEAKSSSQAGRQGY